jgi:hypothetical protein
VNNPAAWQIEYPVLIIIIKDQHQLNHIPTYWFCFIPPEKPRTNVHRREHIQTRPTDQGNSTRKILFCEEEESQTNQCKVDDMAIERRSEKLGQRGVRTKNIWRELAVGNFAEMRLAFYHLLRNRMGIVLFRLNCRQPRFLLSTRVIFPISLPPLQIDNWFLLLHSICEPIYTAPLTNAISHRDFQMLRRNHQKPERFLQNLGKNVFFTMRISKCLGIESTVCGVGLTSDIQQVLDCSVPNRQFTVLSNLWQAHWKIIFAHLVHN